MSDSERKCVGCGKTDPPQHLERFVLVDEFGLIFDLRGKAPGRGAYAHPDAACITRAIEHGFSRSFKKALAPKVSPEPFIQEIGEAIRSRFDESLRVAMRAGRLAIGGHNLEEAMKQNDVEVLFIAADAGDSTARKYRSNAERKGIEVLNGVLGEMLAKPLGKSFVGVLGVSAQSAFALRRDWAALNRLGFFDGGVEQAPEHG